MEKLTQDQLDLIKKPLPSEAVKQHPTKTYLSSIKAIYVTERMNEVFGVGKWVQKVEKESVSSDGMVVVKVTFEVPDYGIYYESYGGNDNGGQNSKNFDLGDAYKGATTDAITKIGSYLGIGIDVFKGLKENNSKEKPSFAKVDIWLNDKEFEASEKADPKLISNLLLKYDNKTKQKDGKVYGIKKEYRTILENIVNGK